MDIKTSNIIQSLIASFYLVTVFVIMYIGDTAFKPGSIIFGCCCLICALLLILVTYLVERHIQKITKKIINDRVQLEQNYNWLIDHIYIIRAVLNITEGGTWKDRTREIIKKLKRIKGENKNVTTYTGLFSMPVLGQEAIVPKYGLGRVTSFEEGLNGFIEVNPYSNGTPMKFDPKNVRLVKIRLEDDDEEY